MSRHRIIRRRWKMGFPWESYVSRSAPPDTKDVIFRAGELGIKVKLITGDHIAIAKKTCRVIGVGTQILTTKDIPANEADTLGDRFGELVEGCDGFAGVHPEHKFQIVRWRQRCACAQKRRTSVVRPMYREALLQAFSQARGVIVKTIDLSRKIFQRMKNYVIYRIACTLQLLVFFFLATMCADPETVMGGKGFLDKSQVQDDDHQIPRYFSSCDGNGPYHHPVRRDNHFHCLRLRGGG